jgi:hypothetical protein
LCASILVSPRRKMDLVEAFHAWGWSWPDLELHGWPWELAREGKEGEGRRGAGGTANSCGLWRGGRGRHGEAAGGARSLYTSVLPCFSVASMRKRKREEKKKGKANKRKSRKRNGKKISNLEIFKEKNKRQFMKLVQKIFF